MNKTRKILIFSLTKSGCTDYSREIVSQLSPLEPLVFTEKSNQAFFSNPIYTVKTYHNFPTAFINSFDFLFKSRKLLITHKRNFKHIVVYCTSFHPWNIILGYWCSKLKIPFYLTVHDYTTHIGEKNTWVEIIQKKTIQYAKKVIFLSQYEKDKAAQNGLGEGSCMVIQHPLLPVQTENTLKFNPKPKVLFVGRLKSYKGVDLLLESLQGLDYEYVTIAGEGKLPTTKTLDSRIKVLNYSLSEKEMNALLMTHEILVLPYKEASQSGILSLGINAHMVMVVSKVGGLPEQLQHNAAAWILPNSKDLKTALEKLIKNEAYYTELKSNIKTEKQRIIQNWKQDLSRLKNMLLDN